MVRKLFGVIATVALASGAMLVLVGPAGAISDEREVGEKETRAGHHDREPETGLKIALEGGDEVKGAEQQDTQGGGERAEMPR